MAPARNLASDEVPDDGEEALYFESGEDFDERRFTGTDLDRRIAHYGRTRRNIKRQRRRRTHRQAGHRGG